MIIRSEAPEDAAAVHEVVCSAFGQVDEADLVAALRAAGDTVLALVAEEDGRIIGHVLLSKMDAARPSLALAPVSVLPGAQRRGVGTGLVKAALQRAREAGWALIFVLGDPGYYQRFGFSIERAAGFSSRYSGPGFMALALTSLPPPLGGDVRHAPSFDALG